MSSASDCSAGLISQAKEKLVDQDALVSSLLTFDFESEGQSDDFGTSDGLSDIWGAVEGMKVCLRAQHMTQREPYVPPDHI